MNSDPTNPTFKVGLTSEEKKLYTQLFKSLDPSSSGIITGETARATFEKSGVLPPILGEIWQLADQNNLGFLSQFGFCQALRLIGYAQSGQHPSAELADFPGPLPKFSNLIVDTPLQAQTTNSSFMKSQPSSLVPQNTTTLQATPSDPISVVTQVDYEKFSSLFAKTVGSVQGELSGVKAKDIFLKAKLPTVTLGHIWNLVDRQNSGKLSVDSFVIAMHLIQGVLSGTIRQLPPFLPESLWQSVNKPVSNSNLSGSRQSSYGSINPQINRSPSISSRNVSSTNESKITPVMKQQFDSIFSSLDTSNSGQLNSSQVASFLMRSNLNQQDLATIWDLSDIHNTGQFGRTEFSIALYLVNKKIAGETLPNVIPSTLIDSLNDGNAANEQAKSTDVPPVKPVQKAKTSMDDLVDIFSSSNPPANVEQPIKPLQRSSSDLSNKVDTPKIPKSLTGSFKPTSNFGQTLLHNNLASPKEEVEEDNLLGDDVPHERNAPKLHVSDAPKEQKVVNYEALRAVPTPPVNKTNEEKVSNSTLQDYSKSIAINSTTYLQNNDLLADNNPEISGKLSQANSDIANVSNQIKSLTGRTTDLHDKKVKAQQELSRILKSKEEIEGKLVQLRTLYDNEVQQVDMVEKKLASSKEESEALRSEASISEAKLNALSGELNEKNAAYETFQQENEALKEKLAHLNSSIVEVENNLEIFTLNNQTLSNQVSVKKSQVQVSFVKSEELKAKIVKLQEANKQLEQDILNAEKEKNALDEQNKNLEKEIDELKSFKPDVKSSNKALTTGASVASAAGVGGVAGAAIAGISGSINHSSNPSDTLEEESTSENLNISDVEKSIDEGKDSSSEDLPSIYDSESVAQVEKLAEEKLSEEIPQQDEEQVMKRFPNVSVNEPATETTNNGTTVSSIATDYKNDDETPITSPSNSEFQFPQDSNQGIVGGMVGMPGVLLGISRTDSLTSSVQNNAALSVRDDNIGEISDRETLENENASGSDRPPTYDYKQSPGTESFEIVNAEEIKSKDSLTTKESYENGEKEVIESSAQRDSARTIPQGSGGMDEEFPPIKELDYDESSSDDESQGDKFDDAVDHLPTPTINSDSGARNENNVVSEKQLNSFDDFENQFSDLEPAAPEDVKDDFEDNFIGMEEAQDDNLPDEFTEQFGTDSNVPDFSEGFTGSPNLNSESPNYFADIKNQEIANDEWEQLFAGFGNSQVQPDTTPVGDDSNNWFDTSVDNSHQQAIHELVGMGFEENIVIDALEKENWNLESATNYLLDNA